MKFINKALKCILLTLVLVMILLNTACDSEYTVTFDGEAQVVTFGGKAIAPTAEEKEGYDFIGWYTESGDAYSTNKSIFNNYDYLSKYEIKKFDITFIVDGESETKSYEYGSTIGDSYNNIKEGYEITGWYENGELFNLDTPIKENHELEATYTIKKYTITYKNGEDVVTTKEVSYHEKADSTVLSGYKTGYTFVGWYYEGEAFDFETLIEQDYILEAYYDVRKCTVIFDNDGEKISVQVVYNCKVTEPTITYAADAEFLGWYCNDQEFDFSTKIIKDTLITAKYKFETRTVSFNSNGEITTQEVRLHKTAEKPANPKIKGYQFIGWYLGDTEYDFAAEVTENITLTAKFEVKYHTITFKYDDKEEVQTVIEGYIAVKPMDLVKDNKVFDGWYLGDSKYDFSSEVLEDIVLTPHFSDYKTDKIYVTYDFGYDCYQTKADLRYAYYSEYYNFLTYKGFNFKKLSINNVDDFITAMTDFYYKNRREMGNIGNEFSGLYLKSSAGSTWEDQPISYFMGYCYQNNKFVDLLYHLQEFFGYWRTDEGYSQSDKNGNDWFASSWASMVDTAKFFYFTTDNLYDEYSWFDSSRVHEMLDYIPGVGYRNLIYSSSTAIELPQDVKRSGYTFLGWYDANGNLVTTVTSSMTVHAKWAEGPVKTMTCLAAAKTKGSQTCNYAATPSQTDNSYIYGPRIIIDFDGTNYYVKAILKGDGTSNPLSYAYRIVSYNKSCYNDPSYLIKVGQKVTITESDGYITFAFYN